MSSHFSSPSWNPTLCLGHFWTLIFFTNLADDGETEQVMSHGCVVVEETGPGLVAFVLPQLTSLVDQYSEKHRRRDRP